MATILFLCTGNYYRSRFAEEYFNYLAKLSNLEINAFSRAISQDLTNNGNVGNIAKEVVEILTGINVPCHTKGRRPISVNTTELDQSDYVYALDKTEHKPMIASGFADFANKVNYLTIGDVHIEPVYVAAVKLVKQIDKLVKELRG